MFDSRRKRALRLSMVILGLLSLGIIYAVLTDAVGFGIPCMFNKMTGLKCPGCGISRMCKCLIKGDFTGAWEYNPMILCLLPVGIAVGADISVRYIKDGSLLPHRWANITVYVMIALLLMFGVLRNLPI